jgi:hypothetical protein
MKRALLVLALFAAGCGSDEPPPEQKPPEGRAETQSIRNTEAVGYSGKAIADKVDAGIKANEEQVKKTEQEATEQPE